MTVGDLRDLVDGDTVLWIETKDGKYLEANEAIYLSHKYDGYDIVRMFVQHYPAMYTHGITVQV